MAVFVLQVEQNSACSADARGKAKSYLGHLLKKDVMLYLHFLRDVTSVLSTLPLAMQRRDAKVTDLHSILLTTEKVLKRFLTRYAVCIIHSLVSQYPVLCENLIHLQDWTSVERRLFLYLCVTMITSPCVCRPGPRLSEIFNDHDVFHTQQLKGNIIAFMSAREKALDGLIRSLCTRFADVEEGVLEVAQITSLQNWPDSDDTIDE